MVCFGWLGYLWYVIYQLVLLGSCNAHWPRLYPKTYSAATDEEEEQRIWASKRGLSCSERTTTTERVVVVVGEKTTTKCICLCPAPCVWQKMICWRLWLPTKCTKHTTVITLRTTTMIAIRQAGGQASVFKICRSCWLVNRTEELKVSYIVRSQQQPYAHTDYSSPSATKAHELSFSHLRPAAAFFLLCTTEISCPQTHARTHARRVAQETQQHRQTPRHSEFLF